MLLSASSSTTSTGKLLFSSTSPPKLHSTTTTTTTASSSSLRTLLAANASTASSSSSLSINNLLHHVTRTPPDDDEQQSADLLSSASAVASAIRRGSNSPVDFVQQIEKSASDQTKLDLPSPDFQRLCIEQLDLFRRIVHPDAVLSVYVRPAGSYVMDRLELRRIICYPGVSVNASDIVILIGNFNIPTGLRAAEAALSSQQVEFMPEHRAFVFPMVKRPFVVGFLVAELPVMELGASSGNERTDGRDLVHLQSPEEAYALPSKKSWTIGTLNDEYEQLRMYNITAEQRLNAINISCSLAMAYVMDQKAMLLQQSSWQNNIRMNDLVEQIRGPLSSIQTLSKMLSTYLKRNEISYDIVEDILVQGDHMRDALHELQDAVYSTKANIMHYNEEALKKIQDSTYHHHESLRSQLSDSITRDTANNDNLQKFIGQTSPNGELKDSEMPMPPMALAPLEQHGIRPCCVSKVLLDLVEAVQPLAFKQQRSVEVIELCQSVQVAVEEPALRQALSNLIEGALLRIHVRGKVEIVSTEAPAGGALVVIDDDGPDMHYMTQVRSLTPFGADLFSENMVEDNMTWNFVAGLTVAREILESYGCVVRVTSPRITDAALGAGGTRIELWLPSFASSSDINGTAREAE